MVALIVPDGTAAQRVGSSSDEAKLLVERAVAEVNARLGRFEQIRRFAILDREFSQETGELTPTLKLRRRVCEEHFAAEIEALYATAPREE